MQEILTTLLLVSAISALATLLLPEKNKKMRRAGELAIALFVLAALVNPLTLLSELQFDPDDLRYPTADLPTGDYTSSTWEEMEKAVGEGIARDLAARYGVRAADVAVSPTLALSDNELTVKSLSVAVSRAAATLDLVAVRAYAEKTYSTTCEVTIRAN